MTTHTMDIATRSVDDVRRAIAVTDARITDERTTPGAIGYTRVTIETA